MKTAYGIGSPSIKPPGRQNGQVRKTSARGLRLRSEGETKHRTSLTKAMKRALRILYFEGVAIRDTKFWRTVRTTPVPLETIIALYDRYLVKIVTENHHRKRQVAELTEIGRLVAERLVTTENVRSGEWIGEEASRLISSFNDFEASPNVYPEPIDTEAAE